MNRITAALDPMKLKKEKALVGFVTAGDPDMETSLDIIRAMCQNGLDILELGIPFSDPTADGPIIQRSSQRALLAGATPAKILDMVEKIREFTQIPIVLFSYTNPVFAMGYETFAQRAAKAGADALLMVDMPPEEAGELDHYLRAQGLAPIRLAAPTTPDHRIKTIARGAQGFIYLISMTGVTGSGGLDPAQASRNISRVRAKTDLPICVGFGISTPKDVAAVAARADGVVVGSAFETLIETQLEKGEAGRQKLAQKLGEFTKDLKAATR